MCGLGYFVVVGWWLVVDGLQVFECVEFMYVWQYYVDDYVVQIDQYLFCFVFVFNIQWYYVDVFGEVYDFIGN